MNIRKLFFAICATVLFFCALVASAQETRSTISGTVADPAGAAIPGDSVVATEIRTGIQTPTKTDKSVQEAVNALPENGRNC